MRCQLREYTIKPGEMEQWIEEWRSKIVPTRSRFGFRVLGAWTVEGAEIFIWIMAYDGAKTFEEANAEYYQSAERKAINPDPARHIMHQETRMLTTVS